MVSSSVSTLRMRTAETLNSGIFETGVEGDGGGQPVRCGLGQWNGMKTVPGAVAPETRARTTISPRRELTSTRSPSATPRARASSPAISTKHAGRAR